MSIIKTNNIDISSDYRSRKHSYPKVLVLVATYNGQIWLSEQINSILNQESVDIHLEIGDDNSKDNTKYLINQEFGNDSRIRVHFWSQSSGSAGANFRRLYIQTDLSEVDYVALADQDDIWLPRKLISAIESINRAGVQGYSCAVQAFWPDGREKVLHQTSRMREADFLFEGAGQGCTFVVRRQLFERVQQFCRDSPSRIEALHYHDWLIYLLTRAWDLPWYFDVRPWMRYRQHDGNEIGSRGSMQAITRRLGLMKSGWYAKQVEAAINLYKLAGGHDPIPLQIEKLINSPSSLIRNLKLMLVFFRHGRRSVIDRCVLSVAALIGWF